MGFVKIFLIIFPPPLLIQVRQSLYETLGDLENKDLQLTLAMQDLTIATDEIKRAAAMRQALQKLERWAGLLEFDLLSVCFCSDHANQRMIKTLISRNCASSLYLIPVQHTANMVEGLVKLLRRMTSGGCLDAWHFW